MQELKIKDLKPHPQNDYFFDDIKDENWTAFVESIRTSGVIEPIVIDATTKIIVSGHQRVRGCKELGIKTIMCEVRIYDSEDKIIKDLLETNLRQRGIGNTNPVKLGRCILELEKIYGIRNGGDRKSEPNNLGPISPTTPTTQSELASVFGITDETLRNYKKLTKLIPEIVDLVDTGIVTSTTASMLISKLSPEEQEVLIASMDVTKKITAKEVAMYVVENEALKSQQTIIEADNNKVIDLELQITAIQTEKKNMQNEIDSMQNQKPITQTVIEEVDSTETLNKLTKLQDEVKKKDIELNQFRKELATKLSDISMDSDNETDNESQLISECSSITQTILDFINKMAPYGYTSEKFDAISDDDVLNEYINSVKAVKKLANNILSVEDDSDDDEESDNDEFEFSYEQLCKLANTVDENEDIVTKSLRLLRESNDPNIDFYKMDDEDDEEELEY
jgi:ParB-like chromosome segregation protein Spo0J